MLGQIWGILKMLREIWETLKVALGLIERAKYDSAKKGIEEAAKVAGDENASEEERRRATKELEDRINRHT